MKEAYPFALGVLACMSLFIQPERLFSLKIKSTNSVQIYYGCFLLPAGALALAFQEIPRASWNLWAEVYIIIALFLHVYAIARPSRSALSKTFYARLFNRELPEEDVSGR
jgi:hypothetical protein